MSDFTSEPLSLGQRHALELVLETLSAGFLRHQPPDKERQYRFYADSMRPFSPDEIRAGGRLARDKHRGMPAPVDLKDYAKQARRIFTPAAAEKPKEAVLCAMCQSTQLYEDPATERWRVLHAQDCAYESRGLVVREGPGGLPKRVEVSQEEAVAESPSVVSIIPGVRVWRGRQGFEAAD